MCGQNLKEKQYITIQKETEQNEKESKKFGGDMKFEQYLRKAETISLAGHEILIWGAGNTAELNKGVIFEEGLCPDFFVDSDPAKQGSRLWDIEIIAPDDIKKHCENPLVFICSVQPKVCRAVKMQLMEMGIVTYHMLDEVVWGRHRKELMTVYQLLETDESKEYFASVIVSRIKGEEVSKINRKDMAYFGMEQFGTGNAEEIFVDCGAFEGDTVEQYVDVKKAVFKEIYAFEPDQRNWEAMQKRIGVLTQKWNLAQSRIHLLKGAAGKQDGSMRLFGNIDQEAVKVREDGEGETVPVYALDSVLKDKNIGFIKADIEGCEMDMIEGAAGCIRRCRPLLAICIYHQSSDLYKIPAAIKELNSDYKMEIVHYGDLYTDTILYVY